MPSHVPWREKVRQLKNELVALYLAYRDRRTPWYARLWLLLVLAYAVSPIDLIPDFVPVLGYLDDLILVPLGIWVALRLVPAEVLVECRVAAQSGEGLQGVPRWLGTFLIGAIWIAAVAVVAVAIWRILKH